MMSDTVNVPHIGALPRKQVYLIVGGGAGIIAFMWWRHRNTAAVDVAAQGDVTPPEDPWGGMTDTGIGGAGPASGYTDDRSSDTGTNAPTTNAAWSDIVLEKLQGSYELVNITDALGRYLGRQPLSSLDQRIVQAAIAVAGYPPEGSYSVIPGGDTSITIAPGGLKGAAGTTSVDLTWNTVAGASRYRVFRADLGFTESIGDSTDGRFTAKGLQPNTAYGFQVAAVDAKGKTGPRSATATVKTTSVALKAPTAVRVTSSTTTSVTASWSKVPGATSYRVYVDGTDRGATETPPYTIRGLAKNHSYRLQVAADTTSQNPGPKSTAVTARTKTK